MEFRVVTSSVTPLEFSTDYIRCYKFGRSAGPELIICVVIRLTVPLDLLCFITQNPEDWTIL